MIKIKNKGRFWFFLILVVLLIGGGIFAFQRFALVGDNFIIPIWGRIECGRLQDFPEEHITSFNENGAIIKCGDNEYSPRCEQVYVQCSEDNSLVAVRFDSHDKIYGSVAESAPCKIGQTGSDTLCKLDVPVSTGSKNTWVPTELTTMYNGQRMQVYCAKPKLFGLLGYNFYPGKIKETYYPYGLQYYLEGARIVTNYQDCTFGNLERGRIKMGTCPNQNPLPFDNWCNFVTKWVIGPSFMNTEIYQGREVFCEGNSISEIDDLVMDNGDNYRIVGSHIKTVECCPRLAGCGSDFKWEPVPEPDECITSKQCANGGVWTSHGGKEIAREVCEDGICTRETKSVECSTNNDCPTNYICDKVNWKCIQQGPTTCGDGVCDKEIGENYYTCPPDCGAPPTPGDCESCFDWLRNKVAAGTFCTPKPAPKILFGLITGIGQNEICPIYLLFLLAISILIVVGVAAGIKFIGKGGKRR